MRLKLFFSVALCVLLSACAAPTKKAPCDQWGKYCGPQTPVNTWYHPKKTNTGVV